MKIIEALQHAANVLQVELDKHSIGVGEVADDFKRGLMVGKQRALQTAISEIINVLKDHTCGSCGALIDNDADNINGRCVRCAKGETDVHIDD